MGRPLLAQGEEPFRLLLVKSGCEHRWGRGQTAMVRRHEYRYQQRVRECLQVAEQSGDDKEKMA